MTPACLLMGTLNDIDMENAFRKLEQRMPTNRLLWDLVSRSTSAQAERAGVYRTVVQQYGVFRDFRQGHVSRYFQSGRKNTFGNRTARNRPDSMLRHFVLLQSQESINRITLDGGSGAQLKKKQPAGAQSLINGQVDNTGDIKVGMQADGRYTIAFDPETKFYGILELGDSILKVKLYNSPDQAERFKIYFNGIEAENEQTIQWLDACSFKVSHNFDHPNLSDISYFRDNNAGEHILVVWNSIQLHLIRSVLCMVFPDPKVRLAWWYKPINQLHGLTPWQCIQLRMEEAVLQYLSNEYGLENTADLE